MGKPKAVEEYTEALSEHYGVTLTVTAEETKGSTAKVLINDTQAVAGVSMKDAGKINPGKPQCGSMASTAGELAEGLNSTAKKFSQGEIYSIGN